MAFSGLRSLAFLVLAACLAAAPASAQSSDPKPNDQQKPEAQSEPAHLAEAARTIVGAAGYPECVHLGENAITLMMKNDLDTAFRHVDLYDRFGCPGAHVQTSFRCLLRFGMPGPKDADTLESRVRRCWLNPAATPPAPPPPATAAVPAAPGTAAH